MSDKVIKSRLRRIPDELHIPDKNGGKAKLLGTGVIEYMCGACHENWWMKSNTAGRCPVCGATDVFSRWTTPVVAFLPQVEK